MKLRIALGLFLSLLFLYLFFWSPDFSAMFRGEIFEAFFGNTRINFVELGNALANAHYEWLFVGVGLLVLSLFFRAQRWRILLRPVYSGIRYWPVYSAMNIGYMINNILPLRMGEILRAYFLGKAENISKSSALATIVVERLVDLMAALTLLIITIFFFPFPDWIRNGLFYMGGAVLLLIAFLVSLLVNTQWTIDILEKLLKPLPQKVSVKVIAIIRSFASGLEIMRSSRHYVAVIGHTIILQSCYILSVFVTLLAFDLVSSGYPAIESNPLLASVVLLIIITIGIGVPSAPGAIGTFHFAVQTGLMLFGVEQAIASGTAIVLHLANIVPLTALGLFFFWRQHLSFSDVKAHLADSKEK